MSKGGKKPVLECQNVDGKHVIFERANYDKHKLKHPELKDAKFFPKRVLEALTKPTLTISSNQPNTTCFYLKEFTIEGLMKYTKVVVVEYPDKKICYVMTAFYIDHIQELQYRHKPKYY